MAYFNASSNKWWPICSYHKFTWSHNYWQKLYSSIGKPIIAKFLVLTDSCSETVNISDQLGLFHLNWTRDIFRLDMVCAWLHVHWLGWIIQDLFYSLCHCVILSNVDIFNDNFPDEVISQSWFLLHTNICITRAFYSCKNWAEGCQIFYHEIPHVLIWLYILIC